MIPSTGPVIGQSMTVETANGQPSKTYQIDFASGRVVGACEGLPAVKQAVYMALMTPRFKHLIYSWAYGREDIPDGTAHESELRRVIVEALRQDSRIISVTNIKATKISARAWAVSFQVVTIYGEYTQQQEVSAGV